MTEQKQSIGIGGEGYQAARDLTINNVMSAEQMAQIMMALAGQLQIFIGEAQNKFDQRCAELRDDILKEFADERRGARAEAFSDPDFQFAVKEAQNSYGRSGKAELRNELVKLLTERSKIDSGTRPALILNDAISVSGSLTAQEYSALAILFIIKYVIFQNSFSYGNLLDRISGSTAYFMDNLPQENFSYEYLESLRCLSIAQVGSANLWNILRDNSPGLFTEGFTFDELMDSGGKALTEEFINKLILHVHGTDGVRLRFNVDTESELSSMLKSEVTRAEDEDSLIMLHRKYLMSAESIHDYCIQSKPRIARLWELWESTIISRCSLTALGKAIAHSAFTGRTQVTAPLSIWVR